MKELSRIKNGEAEKSKRGAAATKRASKNAKSGQYECKIVDGVKYMVLKNG